MPTLWPPVSLTRSTNRAAADLAASSRVDPLVPGSAMLPDRSSTMATSVGCSVRQVSWISSNTWWYG